MKKSLEKLISYIDKDITEYNNKKYYIISNIINKIIDLFEDFETNEDDGISYASYANYETIDEGVVYKVKKKNDYITFNFMTNDSEEWEDIELTSSSFIRPEDYKQILDHLCANNYKLKGGSNNDTI